MSIPMPRCLDRQPRSRHCSSTSSSSLRTPLTPPLPLSPLLLTLFTLLTMLCPILASAPAPVTAPVASAVEKRDRSQLGLGTFLGTIGTVPLLCSDEAEEEEDGGAEKEEGGTEKEEGADGG
eukprot:CAMPEP_0173347614 /NCGR_PEP_ID=MMETSP1144-20121109/13252_1 /TAXON_ID=483371 /ORGANISM="non described non described, Strain CCMP2298" /LENGTH=121 /DNA_ID=CAMNT_0014295121 /DNA_START=11 /DNA_END=373 /DNA_ORIENTATION=+